MIDFARFMTPWSDPSTLGAGQLMAGSLNTLANQQNASFGTTFGAAEGVRQQEEIERATREREALALRIQQEAERGFVTKGQEERRAEVEKLRLAMMSPDASPETRAVLAERIRGIPEFQWDFDPVQGKIVPNANGWGAPITGAGPVAQPSGIDEIKAIEAGVEPPLDTSPEGIKRGVSEAVADVNAAVAVPTEYPSVGTPLAKPAGAAPSPVPGAPAAPTKPAGPVPGMSLTDYLAANYSQPEPPAPTIENTFDASEHQYDLGRHGTLDTGALHNEQRQLLADATSGLSPLVPEDKRDAFLKSGGDAALAGVAPYGLTRKQYLDMMIGLLAEQGKGERAQLQAQAMSRRSGTGAVSKDWNDGSNEAQKDLANNNLRKLNADIAVQEAAMKNVQGMEAGGDTAKAQGHRKAMAAEIKKSFGGQVSDNDFKYIANAQGLAEQMNAIFEKVKTGDITEEQADALKLGMELHMQSLRIQREKLHDDLVRRAKGHAKSKEWLDGYLSKIERNIDAPGGGEAEGGGGAQGADEEIPEGFGP